MSMQLLPYSFSRIAEYPYTQQLELPGQVYRGGRGLVKEEEDATKEAFDGTAQALFLACLQVGGRQERFCCRVPVSGDDGDRMQGGMDPGDEPQAEIRRHPGGSCAGGWNRGARPLEASGEQTEHHGALSGGAQKADGQARTAAEQGMHAVAG